MVERSISMKRLASWLTVGLIVASLNAIPVAAQDTSGDSTNSDVSAPAAEDAAPAPIVEDAVAPETAPALQPAPAVQPTPTPAPAFAPELKTSLADDHRSDQPVKARLLTNSGPAIPRDPADRSYQPLPLTTGVFGAINTVPSPVGVPLFDRIDILPDLTLMTVYLTISSAPQVYAYNCRLGQCQGSAADVWVAMPPAQREQYFGALLDAYEPFAEAINRAPPSPFAPGTIAQSAPSPRAQVRLLPLGSSGVGDSPVLAAAKVALDSSGAGLAKYYVGPHFARDIDPPDDTRPQLPKAQWTLHVTP